LRFKSSLDSPRRNEKRGKVHENVSHIASDGCAPRRHGVGIRLLARSRRRIAYFIAVQAQRQQRQPFPPARRTERGVLTLSDDFVVPDTPDPHWQVVDSDGSVYLSTVENKAFIARLQKEIVLPSYVKNVKKVVIWCAFAEVNLGEASFSSPVMLVRASRFMGGPLYRHDSTVRNLISQRKENRQEFS